jgi:hypothetical protein
VKTVSGVAFRVAASRRVALLPLLGAALGVTLAAGKAPDADAHVVTTKDGKTYEGKVVEDGPERVVVETTFDGRKEIARADVAKVDTGVPPLRDQLAFRVSQAKADPKALLEAADWAKRQKFGKPDLDPIFEAVLQAEPQNARARKALGHVKVGATWMTPEEKAAADAAAEEAAQRAKGLVPHEGRWVTPEEKAALEKGLVKDGAEWVTEEEFHRRRGERLVDGKWVRVGEKEARDRASAWSKATSVTVTALWAPNVDLFHELEPEQAKTVLEAAQKSVEAFRRLVQPEAGDRIADLRLPVVCFVKAPAYARFAQVFSEENRITSIPGQENFPEQAKRQPSFWNVQPPLSGHYLFPNTVQRLASGVSHNVTPILLTLWKRPQFPSVWLREGLAYVIEMQAIGRSETYTVGRGGGVGGGDPASWVDSAKWKESLLAAVRAQQDVPLPRLAKMSIDQMSYPELVKAWSVVDYLVKTDAAKTRAFLAATKQRDKEEEEALRESWGLDYRGLEAKWRAFAEAGFGGS